MAIREVQEIPTGHKKTKKDIIWDDIQEAISKDITKFEFVGDEYDYRHLCSYARMVVAERVRELARPILTKAKRENGWRFTPTLLYPTAYERQYIKITQRKEDGRNHVYCEIDKDAFDMMVEDSIEAYRKKHEAQGE